MAKKTVKAPATSKEVKPVKLNKNVTALQTDEPEVQPKKPSLYGKRREATVSTEGASQQADEHRKNSSKRIKSRDGIHVIDPSKPANFVAPTVK